MRLWDATTGAHKHTITDRRVRLRVGTARWDATTGAHKHTITGHATTGAHQTRRGIKADMPSGNYGALRLWDAPRGRADMPRLEVKWSDNKRQTQKKHRRTSKNNRKWELGRHGAPDDLPSIPAQQVKEDINGDGVVNILDVVLVKLEPADPGNNLIKDEDILDFSRTHKRGTCFLRR